MPTTATEDFTQAGVNLVRLVFSLMFPLVFITACGVSGVLLYVFHIPHFGLLWVLAWNGTGYAATHLWAGVALAILVLAALPLAWVALAELALKISSVLGLWITAIICSGFSFWLPSAWPYDSTWGQLLTFAVLLFLSWSVICEALMGTLKLVLQMRPKPGREIVERQKAHGHARVAREDEAVALLRTKK